MKFTEDLVSSSNNKLRTGFLIACGMWQTELQKVQLCVLEEKRKNINLIWDRDWKGKRCEDYGLVFTST